MRSTVLPEGDFNFIMPKINIIIHGEDSISFNVVEGQQSVVKTILLTSNKLWIEIKNKKDNNHARQ